MICITDGAKNDITHLLVWGFNMKQGYYAVNSKKMSAIEVFRLNNSKWLSFPMALLMTKVIGLDFGFFSYAPERLSDSIVDAREIDSSHLEKLKVLIDDLTSLGFKHQFWQSNENKNIYVENDVSGTAGFFYNDLDTVASIAFIKTVSKKNPSIVIEGLCINLVSFDSNSDVTVVTKNNYPDFYTPDFLSSQIIKSSNVKEVFDIHKNRLLDHPNANFKILEKSLIEKIDQLLYLIAEDRIKRGFFYFVSDDPDFKERYQSV